MRMEDIAEKAGVSQATVSRVLSGHGGVSQAKTRAVLEWAGKFGFTPKRRRPRPGGGTVNIGFFFSGRDFCRAGTALLQKFTALIRDIPEKYGICFLPVGMDAAQFRRELVNRKISGLLIAGHHNPPELAPILKTVPHVWLNSHDGPSSGSVLRGNREAGRTAAAYLTGHGCTRLGAIRVPSRNPGYAARIDGFLEEAERCGCRALVFPCGEPEQYFEEIEVSELEEIIGNTFTALADLAESCDGFFCPDDRVTAILYRILLKRELILTRRLRVISCNNDRNCLAGLSPRPATIDFAPELSAKIALHELLRQLEKKKDRENFPVIVSPVLVPGDEL